MKVAIVLLLGLILFGCGGMTGTTRLVVPFPEVVRAHKALAVTADPQKPEWAPVGRAMATKLVPKLDGLGFFATVVDDAGAKQTQTDLELRLTIQDVLLVSADARSKSGRKAGPTKVVVTARLFDRATQAELARADFTAQGDGGPHGGTTEDAEDEVIRRLILLVSGKTDE